MGRGRSARRAAPGGPAPLSGRATGHAVGARPGGEPPPRECSAHPLARRAAAGRRPPGEYSATRRAWGGHGARREGTGRSGGALARWAPHANAAQASGSALGSAQLFPGLARPRRRPASARSAPGRQCRGTPCRGMAPGQAAPDLDGGYGPLPAGAPGVACVQGAAALRAPSGRCMDPAGVGLYLGAAAPDALGLATQRAAPGPRRPGRGAMGDAGRCACTAMSAGVPSGPSPLEAAPSEESVGGINATG